MQTSSLLAVKGLTIGALNGQVLVSDLHFSLGERENVGLLGESGSGKSLTAMALLRLLPWPPILIQKGEIYFMGQDLCLATDEDLQKIRGRLMAAICQDPLASLNPVRRLGFQLREIFSYHSIEPGIAEQRIQEVLRAVGLRDGQQLMDQYPHQISGGMRQRFLIAMAIALRPRLLIADEPSSALDATLQAQMIALLLRLQREENMSILFISHDLGVLAELCSSCIVLYRGHLLEKAPIAALLAGGSHPYSRALLAHLPGARRNKVSKERAGPRLRSGAMLQRGCIYEASCEHALDLCRAEVPPLRLIEDEHWVACHRAGEI